ncbi:hypothetical protein GGI12_004708 [Dipsacomyces acuminosporus]|nr:hypothetical protein GGI12_004708 [Dipsacomyces acuminosporus]
MSNLDKAARARAVRQGVADRVNRAGQFILRKLAQKQQLYSEKQAANPPLVIGLNGAQGSGKTTLVRGLVEYLNERSISTVGFSLDDIYLTNAEQRRVSMEHPDNPLLRFRGQPGTHDLALGKHTLESLLQNTHPTPVPAYDKSLQNGYGDRVPQSQWKQTSPPIDVVLFEGWNLGFRALDDQEFAKYIANVQNTTKNDTLYKHSRKYSAENLKDVNDYLKSYEEAIYPLIDAWVYMRIADIDVVYRWRKEQEDELAASGRPSLSDGQLEDFVSRFLPGYEMALGKLDTKGFVCSDLLPKPNTLRLHLDLSRNVVALDHKF